MVSMDPRFRLPSFRILYKTLGRDLRAMYLFAKLVAFLKKCHSLNMATPHLFRKVAKKHPDKVCFIFEGEKWTYQQVEEFSNRVANYFAAQGFQKGDEVALFMENRPEYACIWLGLSMIGVIPALINTNLRLDSLAHSINVIECKALIYGTELSSAVKDVVPLLKNKESMKYFSFGANAIHLDYPTKSLDIGLKDVSAEQPADSKHKINFSDKLLYIYTSGTTDLPKAAIIRHSRLIWIAAGSRMVIGIRESDVMYNPLPMYHIAGGLFFLSTVLTLGGTMVIKKKFSASNFWKDAIKHNCTVSQYIGEICRYLLTQPDKPEDKLHKIRIMCGNGLRVQIWEEFVERFNIGRVIEIYGATEGNANLANITGKVGAVGFIPRLFAPLYPVNLVRVDPKTGAPMRNSEGLCVRCNPGEPGEIVGKILKNNPINSFDGYSNQTATRKKIIHDCFQKGDTAFLSGDVLTMDAEGYLYFLDRTGDTFRWRGENVSTSEVEGIISKVLNLTTCVVYGVEIPGVEGRAGMAAVQNNEGSLDIKKFHNRVSRVLPSYAVPVFIRLCSDIEATGTYKLRKVELQREGYNLKKIKDPLYFLDPQIRSYVRLNETNYQEITEGKVRL